MANFCAECKLNEMIVTNSAEWRHSDLFKPCTLSFEAYCRVCNNTEKITKTFQNITEYHNFLDKYKDK